MSSTGKRHSVSSTYGRKSKNSDPVDHTEESNYSDTATDDCQVVKVSKNKRGQNSGKSTRPSKGAESDTADTDEGTGDEDESEEQYEVTEIKNHKVQKGQVKYFVGWKGYTSDDDSWEPESNLQGAQELLNRYKSTHGLKSKGSRQSTASAKSSAKRTRDQNDEDGHDDSVSEQSSNPKRKKETKDLLPTPDASVNDKTRKNGQTSSKRATNHEPPASKNRASSEVGDLDVAQAEWHDRHRNEKSWEHLVHGIETIEQDSDDEQAAIPNPNRADRLHVALMWKNGPTTFVTNATAREKVPQKLLDFYEDHLEFKSRPAKDH